MPKAKTPETEEKRKQKISLSTIGKPKPWLEVAPEVKEARRKAYHQQYYQEHKERYAQNAKRWFNEHPERTKEIRKQHNIRHKEQQLKWARAKRAKQRYECLLHYSEGSLQCGRCGIADIDVLCLDHINNDGGLEKKCWGNGNAFYTNIYRLGFPEGYQVLCWNCNHKKELERSRNGKNISR